MTATELDHLWRAEKWINDEIQWLAVKGHSDLYGFDDIPVFSDLDVDLLLDGTYNCRTGAVTFNFKIKDLGPVIRYDAGGPVHDDAGRFHMHRAVSEECPRRNLPHAESRPTLEGLEPKQVWAVVCGEGNVVHNDDFWRPEVKC